GLRSGAEGDTGSGTSFRVRGGAQPHHQPRAPRADRAHRKPGRSRCAQCRRRRTRPRPQCDGARGTAPPAIRSRQSAAALPPGRGAEKDRRPVAQGNRPTHGYQRRHGSPPSHRRPPRARRSSLWRGLVEMSDVSAHTVRLTAAEWHDRRERDDWTKDDQAALAAWLAQSPAHKVAFLRVDAVWKRADRLTALKPSGRIRRFANLAQFWPITIRMVAAAIVVTAVGFAAAPYFKEKSTVQSYSTTIGGRETLALADGSQIDLNTDTAVRVDISRARRTIWLDKGEAFFKVRHDAQRPFEVMVGDRRITDIG